MREFLKTEPVAAGALARIGVLLVAKFGVELSLDEVLGLMVALEVLGGYLTRQRVTPA